METGVFQFISLPSFELDAEADGESCSAVTKSKFVHGGISRC